MRNRKLSKNIRKIWVTFNQYFSLKNIETFQNELNSRTFIIVNSPRVVMKVSQIKNLNKWNALLIFCCIKSRYIIMWNQKEKKTTKCVYVYYIYFIIYYIIHYIIYLFVLHLCTKNLVNVYNKFCEFNGV